MLKNQPQERYLFAMVISTMWDCIGMSLKNYLPWVLALSPGTYLAMVYPRASKALSMTLMIIKKALQKPWHVVAQSTGAAIVMDYLLHLENNNNPFTKIVLLAPLYRPRGWRMAKLRYYLARPFVKFVEREPTRSSHDQSFIDFVSQDPLRINHLSVQWVGELIKWESQIKLLPATEEKVVIIQGRQDQTVDWKTNIKFIKEKFLNAQVHYIPEAKHHLVNESAAIRNQVFDIMEHALIEDCCI